MNGLFIMEDFWEKVAIKKIPHPKKALLDKKIINWSKMTLDELLKDFKSQNSKKFYDSASGIPIFKYRISDSDRIVYTYARDLQHPDIVKEDEDNIVLLYYTQHDEQDSLVKRRVNWVRPVKKYGQAMDRVVYPPCLSTMQRNCLKRDFPMLIFAGAGSGKTTIAVRKMQQETSNTDEESRAAYIAISNRLIDKAKKEYDSNEDESGGSTPEFYTPEELCKSLLGVSEDAITFDEFNRDFFIPTIKSNLTALALWTEIRGVIKGYMGNTWRRTLSVRQDMFDSGFNKRMVENQLWARRQDVQPALLFLPNSMSVKTWYNEAKKIGSDASFNKNIKKAKDYFENVGNWEKEISFDEYIALDNKNLDTMATRYSRVERIEIYRLYDQYKIWLKENGRFDDNDLAYNVLAAGKKELFSLIVVDEAQDFTQLQMLMLFSLAKPYRYPSWKEKDLEETVYKMVIVGDVHQTIHPTYFNLEHLKQLFFIHTGKTANENSLPESHRSYSEVIEAANSLSAIRQEKIGKMDLETEEIPNAIHEGGKAFTLKNDIAYLHQIVGNLGKVPDYAIIVPNEAEKKRFKSDFNAYGEWEKLFTVEEIKGLELKFVVCFNILSVHADAWQEIMTQDIKQQTQYRFYFNMLYVAITRAIKYVCIYEEKYDISGIHSIVDLFGRLEKDYFSKKIFDDIKTDDIDAWLKSALNFENAEKYEAAIVDYTEAGLDENSIEILRCRASLEEKNGNYAKAVEYYCNMGDSADFKGFEAAYKASKKSDDKRLELYISLLLKTSLTEIDEGIPQDQVLSAIRTHGGKGGKASEKLYAMLSLALEHNSNEFLKITNKFAVLGD